MTRPITDSELYAAIDGAFDLWQSRYEGDLPAHTFSAGFEEKIAAIPDRHPVARRKPVRTAAAAAIIAAALTMTIGADVVPAMTRIIHGPINGNEQILHKSTDWYLSSDYDHEGETRRPVLNWMPEGWVEEKRSVFKNSTHIHFKKEDNLSLTISTHRIRPTTSMNKSTNTENAKVSFIHINGNEARLVVNENAVILDWFVENYLCTVCFIRTTPVEDAIKIAENIILK